MSGVEVYENGVFVERWDDNTRTYADFRTDPVTTRPYTAQEHLDADERAAQATEDANRRTVDEALDLRMGTMQAIVDDTNANINSNPAARIKDIARAVRLLIRQARGDFDGIS
jgi:hypothetical protein